MNSPSSVWDETTDHRNVTFYLRGQAWYWVTKGGTPDAKKKNFFGMKLVWLFTHLLMDEVSFSKYHS